MSSNPLRTRLATLAALGVVAVATMAQLNRVSWAQVVGTRTSSIPVTITGLATTSTDGIIAQNTTAATAGVPVQISPRLKLCGTAYNSTSTLSETDCFFFEALPTTVAGTTTATLKIGYIAPSGAVTYPATLNSVGGLVAISSVVGPTVGVGGSGSGNTLLTSTANGQLNLLNNAASAGVGLNGVTDGKLIIQTRASGTASTQVAITQTTVPTCSSNCGTGSPTVVGSDTAGVITLGTTPASGFVVTFNGTWAAAPACVVQSALTTMAVGKIPIAVQTAQTTMTVTTNGVAPATSDKYAYACWGVQ